MGSLLTRAEGYSRDGICTQIDVDEPLVQAYVNIPNQSGNVSLVVAKDGTAYTATNQTTVSMLIPFVAGAVPIGRAFRFTCGGTIAGANAAKSVTWRTDTTDALTLTTALGAVGGWIATFYIYFPTVASQRIVGILAVDAVANIGSRATAAVNFATAHSMGMTIVSGNASDTVTQDWAVCELLP